MKSFDKSEVTEVLGKIKKAIIDKTWSIEINDIVKKKPSFYTIYDVDLENIKRIINNLEVEDFECKIENIINNQNLQFIYLFKKYETFSDKKVNIYVRLCLLDNSKKLLVSISEVKFD